MAIQNLVYAPQNGYDRFNAEDLMRLETYAARYRHFIDRAKTERETVAETIRLAEKHGFTPFSPGMDLKAGDKIYQSNREKSVIFAVIGEEPLCSGCRITVAHGDSPRLDVKPSPLCEAEELGLLKTHYYGGIKKYQWTTMPLALHGVFCMKDGSVRNVNIGESPEDPVFCVTDLLPHLSNDQMQKTMREGISGENMKVLFGSTPIPDGGYKERVKMALLSRLHDYFGIEEADFLSAELTLVPAWNCREIGLDRSMLGAYGHDDRVCAYAEFEPLLDMQTPKYTSVCLIADKEEVGSVGVSGMQSRLFDYFMEDLCQIFNCPVRRCLSSSLCMSADVVNAMDPLYPDVSDGQNCARLNHGVVLAKYTGRAGKGGCSDAAGEVVARFRRMFDAGNILSQLAELGKVDQGGGGTVAGYMANRGIDTLDVGVGVLSMHSPMEVISKLDCYMLYKAASVFYLSD